MPAIPWTRSVTIITCTPTQLQRILAAFLTKRNPYIMNHLFTKKKNTIVTQTRNISYKRDRKKKINNTVRRSFISVGLQYREMGEKEDERTRSRRDSVWCVCRAIGGKSWREFEDGRDARPLFRFCTPTCLFLDWSFHRVETRTHVFSCSGGSGGLRLLNKSI